MVKIFSNATAIPICSHTHSSSCVSEVKIPSGSPSNSLFFKHPPPPPHTPPHPTKKKPKTLSLEYFQIKKEWEEQQGG